MSSINDAKKKIKQFNSLSKVAKQLGFFLSDDYAEVNMEFVLIPISLKNNLEEMMEIRKQSGYRKRYPVIDCGDMEQVILALSSIAIAKNKYLDRKNSQDETWYLTTVEKLTKADLSDLNKE